MNLLLFEPIIQGNKEMDEEINCRWESGLQKAKVADRKSCMRLRVYSVVDSATDGEIELRTRQRNAGRVGDIPTISNTGRYAQMRRR